MLTDRVLPPTEWSRLTEGGLAQWTGCLPPDKARIVIVEEGDQIVGTVGLLSVVHAEGVWIHPDHRGKTAVGRRLWSRLKQTAATSGIQAVLVSVDEANDQIFPLIASRARPTGKEFVLWVQ